MSKKSTVTELSLRVLFVEAARINYLTNKRTYENVGRLRRERARVEATSMQNIMKQRN